MEKPLVIINQDSGYLTVDILNYFTERGRKCILITGRIIERDKPLDKSVYVKKIIKYNRKNTFNRIFTWGIGTFQILFNIVFRFRRSELFIVSNPPFSQLLLLFKRSDFSLLIFDVFPDAFVEFKIFSKKSFLYRLWAHANRKVYSRAKYIYTLTEGMKDLIKNYVDESKISVVPLWTDNKFLKPLKKEENAFVARYNLLNKFVVLYSGNFGLAHHVSTIVDLAEIIKDNRIFFLLIGEGPEKNKIEQKISASQLNNILLLPWQKPEMLPLTLSCASLAVVGLSAGASKLGIPSKFYNFLSVGVPIMSMSASGSELEKMVNKYKVGKSFSPSMISEMCKFILDLAANPQLHSKLSENSLQASKSHTQSNLEYFKTF
jgi:glycosyltransferase involved in cell wall biosynthesis